jgi:galactose mutarotase-like enzyme
MDGFTYRGIDTVFLENERLRVMVLPGKGGDILEFRDKASDVDVLWHADHNWQPPGDRVVPSLDATTWHDHYPGGWQVNLPVAGYTEGFGDAPYGLHGESALLPFEYTCTETDDEVRLSLSTTLVRYPFSIERSLTLPADEPRLRVDETVTNTGGRAVPYIWQHHLALGRPLIGPDATLSIPAATGVVEEYGPDHENARLASGETFDWPTAPAADGGTVDMRRFPPEDATIHDVVYATELTDGRYEVTNPTVDVTFGITFPTDPFECVWYWQPFNGYAESPYYNRNYTVGLEPTTAYPSADIPEAQEATGTLKTLEAGESISTTVEAGTAPADGTGVFS